MDPYLLEILNMSEDNRDENSEHHNSWTDGEETGWDLFDKESDAKDWFYALENVMEYERYMREFPKCSDLCYFKEGHIKNR